ncbi:gamma-glutamyltranspeptidase [Pseudoclavibacter sp. CFCC 11306]|nr:gamma-glutamyltranspeptidase [Pseudoclavibacter sp. CFCC 11306]
MELQVTYQGAIATAHDSATKAGAETYKRGGNAVDAALAAALALAVVYPHNTSIGGDAVIIVRTPEGEVRCINATGWASKNIDLDALTSRYGQCLPDRGIDTITLPGAIRGFESLHQIGAQLPWEAHFDEAVHLALHGSTVGRSLASAIAAFPWQDSGSTSLQQLFLPNGAPLREGDRFVQPELAATLDTIAHKGADSFYQGSVMQDVVSGLQAMGSVLEESDFTDYCVELVAPISTAIGDLTVLTSPPNTQGFSLIKYLNTLKAERVSLAEGLHNRADLFASCFFESNRLRDSELADPHFSVQDTEYFCSPLGAQRSALPQQIGDGDTVGIAAADSDGWAVSLIFSVFKSFGAGIRDSRTGVLFQDRGTAFSLSSLSPNVIAARKRPRHTLMPVLVLDDKDELAWVQATMGGSGQPQIHAQLLSHISCGATLSEALAAPRMNVGARGIADALNTVYVERSVSALPRQALSKWVLREVPDLTDWMGHANIVRVAGSMLEAAADPRSDGAGMVVRLNR